MDWPGRRAPANGSAGPKSACRSRRRHTRGEEAQPEFVEALDDAKGRALAGEQIEHHAHGAPDFLVGIEHNLIAVPNQPNRQGEAQLTLGSGLHSVEARADDVQLRLGEGPLHA